MIHEQLARPKSKMEPWATTRALCLVILLNLSTVFGNQILEGDGVCQRDEICPFFEKNVIINYFLISLANILAVAEISRASAASKQETISPPLAEKNATLSSPRSALEPRKSRNTHGLSTTITKPDLAFVNSSKFRYNMLY